MKTVLSTKKLSEKNKIRLEDAGFLIMERSFIKIRPKHFQLDKCYDLLLFTSKNAVKSVLKNKKKLSVIKGRECLCVGKQTRKFLKKKEFKVLAQAENARELGKLIVKDYNNRSFTFFSGSLRRNELPQLLAEHEIVFNEIEVYETVFKSYTINVKTDAILFFSPSGVQSFLKENQLEEQDCFCIGKTTAKALEDKTENCIVAPQPSVEAVIETVIKYYK